MNRMGVNDHSHCFVCVYQSDAVLFRVKRLHRFPLYDQIFEDHQLKHS